MNCNVCGAGCGGPLYESADDVSITTMNTLVPGRTRVHFCSACGHLQTEPLADLALYYAQEYEVNLAGAEVDQLYGVIDGKPVFRADHQANVAYAKLSLSEGARVLDFGCAKGDTLRKLCAKAPGIVPFLFDVTDKYRDFWRRFAPEGNWATFEPAPEWVGTMDAVLSFYAFEHVDDIAEGLRRVARLLRPGGVFYLLVPNAYANAADFVVADHINHFSATSLRRWLSQGGFTDIEVDATSHDAAFVVTARLRATSEAFDDAKDVARSARAARALADFWSLASTRIREFEAASNATSEVAIYGAGFYGNYILSTLREPSRVRVIVDQNPHLQGTVVHGCPVIAPMELPPGIGTIFIGLNPRRAREVIDGIAAWRPRALDLFFL